MWAGEAEVYFLADRKSVTRYIFAGNPFPEREVVVRRDFEAKRPRVVVTYNERAGILWNTRAVSLLTELGYEKNSGTGLANGIRAARVVQPKSKRTMANVAGSWGRRPSARASMGSR